MGDQRTRRLTLMAVSVLAAVTMAGCGGTSSAPPPVTPTTTPAPVIAESPPIIPSDSEPTETTTTTSSRTARATVRSSPLPASPGKFVHQGAFCTPEGSIGYTDKGTKERCRPSKPGQQPRWGQ